MPERAVLCQDICEVFSPVVWVAALGFRRVVPEAGWAAAEKSGARPAEVAEEAEECSLVVSAAVTDCLRAAAAGCSAADQSPASHRVRGCR